MRSPSEEASPESRPAPSPRSEPPPAPRRRRTVVLSAITATIALLALVVWRAHSNEPATARAAGAGRAVPVVADSVRVRDFAVHLTALGTVTPLRTVAVRSRVDGQLLAVHFVEGQVVSAGELLAVLDSQPFEAFLEQGEAQAARDSSLLENARADLDRYQHLLELDSVARQQVDTQAALVHQYEAQLRLDQAAIKSTALQLQYAHIRADFAGRVGLRLVDPGNLVHASDPGGITVLTQLQPISVLFSIPQRALADVMPRFRAGDPLPVAISGSDGQATIATGRVVAIDNEIDLATGTIKVRAEFPNDDQKLFPNQFVNVRLLSQQIPDAAVAPAAAVQRGTIGTFAYVVGAGDTVHVRPITVGPTEGESAVVTEGLAPGERVVVDGVDRLREGSVVQLLAPETQHGAAGHGGGHAGGRGRRAATHS
jgi:multidrug efflux system membrane fusion protein